MRLVPVLLGACRTAAASLAPGFARFLRREPVGGATRVRRLAPLPSCLTGLLGGEAVRCSLGVRCFAALAGNRPLFLRIHGGKAALTLVGHGWDLFCSNAPWMF